MAEEEKVQITNRPWLEIVEEHDPTRWTTQDPSYAFSNGRKFVDPKSE
ncbi:MAG: hypothetical protein ACREVZ_10485 [Burkholderiales bacterium]